MKSVQLWVGKMRMSQAQLWKLPACQHYKLGLEGRKHCDHDLMTRLPKCLDNEARTLLSQGGTRTTHEHNQQHDKHASHTPSMKKYELSAVIYLHVSMLAPAIWPCASKFTRMNLPWISKEWRAKNASHGNPWSNKWLPKYTIKHEGGWTKLTKCA